MKPNMKLSNARNFVRTGDSPLNWKYTAEVDCTVYSFFGLFKKTTTRKVVRKQGRFWFFLDTGTGTPGFQMEVLSLSAKFLNDW